MRASRFVAAAVAVAASFSLVACGGDEPKPANSGKKSGSASAPAKQSDGPKDSSKAPKAVEFGSLPSANNVAGVVLVQQNKDLGCNVLFYDNGLKKFGTFAAPKSASQQYDLRCDTNTYSINYTKRVSDVSGTGGKQLVVVQDINANGQKVISGSKNMRKPVVGPDNRVYVQVSAGYLGGDPSVMNLDGSGLAKVPNGKQRPAWLGGKMVKAEFASNAVSNPDGSLAVEYLESLPNGGTGYRVGKIEADKRSGPVINNDGIVVVPAPFVAEKPLAWVGKDGFLTSHSGKIFLNTIRSRGGKYTVGTEEFTILPKGYLSGSTDPVQKMVVCGSTAYFTIHLGGTQAQPAKQSVLLGLDLKSGGLSALASVKNDQAAGAIHTTEVMGCAK